MTPTTAGEVSPLVYPNDGHLQPTLPSFIQAEFPLFLHVGAQGERFRALLHHFTLRIISYTDFFCTLFFACLLLEACRETSRTIPIAYIILGLSTVPSYDIQFLVPSCRMCRQHSDMLQDLEAHFSVKSTVHHCF